MRIVTTAILIAFLLAAAGCTKDNTQTAPLDKIAVKEVLIPIAVCPKSVDQVSFPTKPTLAINTLSPSDRLNYDKVGKAYMQSIADLVKYSADLEGVAHGVQDICRSVNTQQSEAPR